MYYVISCLLKLIMFINKYQLVIICKFFIGGGIHAKAGLGNGGFEAKAGLGGVLGSSEEDGTKSSSVLYADSNFGDVLGIPKIEKGQKHKYSKNIQVIPRPNKDANSVRSKICIFFPLKRLVY